MDRYKRSISKKNKIYRPYTILGIGNFYFHINSPSAYFDSIVWQVYSSGRVEYVNGDYGVQGSYGCIYNRRTRFVPTPTTRGM